MLTERQLLFKMYMLSIQAQRKLLSGRTPSFRKSMKVLGGKRDLLKKRNRRKKEKKKKTKTRDNRNTTANSQNQDQVFSATPEQPTTVLSGADNSYRQNQQPDVERYNDCLQDIPDIAQPFSESISFSELILNGISYDLTAGFSE